MSYGAASSVPGGAGIHLGKHFHYGEANYGCDPNDPSDDPDAPLGVLKHFKGAWVGPGFNTIFRPNNAPTPTTFPTPVTPAPPTPPNAAVLELNLTREELVFSKPLGSVPNRGFDGQKDIFLNGVSYIQVVKDVTNTETGKPDDNPMGIHTETGFWLNVPATDNNPVVGNTLVRMASIPHGTTINAQGAPPTSQPSAPSIGKRDITPFVIKSDPTVFKPQHTQKADLTDTPRLPQDLSKFIKEGTITQEILDNPTKILLDINEQLNITNTLTFEVNTASDPPPPFPPTSSDVMPNIPGGGTANIAFLVGKDGGASPNANAIQMVSTFWVETIESEITFSSFKKGADPLRLKPKYKAIPGRPAPELPWFTVAPNKTITTQTTIPVKYTQIQYEQIVLLNFHGLSWPHLSLATLVPAEDLEAKCP
ncbi:hypothetical protein Micbo1qcDRAFT_189596 [Microdochium bolleyi]|uniref:Uncharacterized protein n=1 Tax=Microdochium bolleyi TaxID=196109 RepID=A0A136IWY6_9PEZI|nr:hypothetical protein Micbo1qcDRAFT_189596 [Microdochium bolleyi]